jgi:hypothetical protein
MDVLLNIIEGIAWIALTMGMGILAAVAAVMFSDDIAKYLRRNK